VPPPGLLSFGGGRRPGPQAIRFHVSWTVAKATDEPPAEGSNEPKKAKKSSKKKKSEGIEEKKPE
jgi:hypothetical protein